MYDDADRLTEVRHEDAAEDALHKTTYVWTINNWVVTRTKTDYTVSPATEAVVTFEYDNRGRLLAEERVVDDTTTVYDLSYTYDQLGNRETRYDAVTELKTEYTYDVELEPDDPDMPYATHNNRLLYYELYDEDPTPRKLLRTVNYTYYDDGNASNITIKDEDPTGSSAPAYDVHRDLALYYNADGSLRIALWDSWKLNQSGNPTDYEPNYAHEFRYDGPRARHLDAFYDDLYSGQDPNRWPLDQTVSWSEHVGNMIYNDGELTREEDPGNPGEFLFDYTETEHYLGPEAQENVTSGDLRYSHSDLIHSTMLTTDDFGDAEEAPAVTYGAFGEVLDANGSPGGEPPTDFPRYQYAGGWGYESGLITLQGVNTNLPPITLQHVGERWYQPDIGRFVQRDPIGIQGGLNVYAYVQSHPTSRVDPSGLFFEWYSGAPLLANLVLFSTPKFLDSPESTKKVQKSFLVASLVASGGASALPICVRLALLGAGGVTNVWW